MKLRLVKLVVHPVVVADDGQNLTEVKTEPLTISAAELDSFPQSFRRLLQEQERSLSEE